MARKHKVAPPPKKVHLRSYICVSCTRRHSPRTSIGLAHRKFAGRAKA